MSADPSRRWRPLSGVRGRVVLTVLVVTACLYSLLGTIGFLYIADGGRDSIRERVTGVVDQLEAGLRAGTGAVSLFTPDGVEAVAVEPGAPPPVPSGDVKVTRTITVGSQTFLLVGHASQVPLTDSLRSLHTGLWIGVPLAVLVTALVAGVATRRALRPVSVITEQAAAIDAHDVSTRVPVPDTDDEVEHLARTVNEMLDRIAAGQQAQRQFTSDAAHELRTPLMALLGEIELARRSSAPPDPQLLDRLDDLAQRLARRVDDLVLLSTLDEQPPLDRRPTDLLEVVRTEAAALAVGESSSPIAVVGDETTAVVDERLVSRAVRNLLEQRLSTRGRDGAGRGRRQRRPGLGPRRRRRAGRSRYRAGARPAKVRPAGRGPPGRLRWGRPRAGHRRVGGPGPRWRRRGQRRRPRRRPHLALGSRGLEHPLSAVE